MTTATTRIWTFAAILAIVVVVALGWFLGISPQLANADRFDSEREDVVAQNDIARLTIQQLEADFERIDELQDEIDALRVEFPQLPEYDDATEDFFRDLLGSDLELSSLTFSEPSPANPEDGADEIGVVEAGTLLRVPVTLGVAGGLAEVLDFVERIQTSPRFALVSGISFSGGGSTEEEAVITVAVYVISGESAVDPATEPASPADTAEDDEDA